MKKLTYISILVISILSVFALAVSADFYVIPVRNSSEAGIPTGGIIMWSGSIATIPSSWQLCDGTNGTPDLREKFIVGAGDEGSGYLVGDTGGETSIELTISQMPAHSHSIPIYSTVISGFSPGGSEFSGTMYTVQTASSGDGEAHENRPPYYALAYIMKL